MKNRNSVALLGLALAAGMSAGVNPTTFDAGISPHKYRRPTIRKGGLGSHKQNRRKELARRSK